MILRIFLCFCAATLVVACANPSINLSTRDPIKVDINVKMDVYQHGGTDMKPAVKTDGGADVETRRRNRMGEIQSLKNSRLIGETRTGLLAVLSNPPGDMAEYAEKVVAAENADREELMARMATEQQISLEDVRANQARLFRELAFKGEWIEIAGPDGDWKWVQKSE